MEFNKKEMTYENLVGLQVTNRESYDEYRRRMTPILEAHGGGFRYDFELSKVLKNESGNPMNRLFAIFFEDRIQMKAFFEDAEYVAIREEFFVPAVECVTVISEYDR